MSVTLPCAWAGCLGVATLFSTLGIWELRGSWTHHAELKEAGWSCTEGQNRLRGCSRHRLALSSSLSVPLQAERHRLRLGMAPLPPVVRPG